LSITSPKRKRGNTAGLASHRQTLRSLRNQLKTRGIRRGDARGVYRLLDRAERELRRKQARRVAQTMSALERSIDGVVIDQNFIEAKLDRLNRALIRSGMQARYKNPVREILDYTLRSRFEEANRTINRVFDQLARHQR
jgi:hypothetical protein